MIDNEKLKEILKELVRPPKFEVGFVDARRIISDGLSIIGLDSTDILGFAKDANETRERRVKGAQAWYKRMYEDGWKFAGAFEYEGLLYNGFVVMERELPNKRLGELIETLTDERVVRTGSAMELDRGPDLPGLVAVPGSLKPKIEEKQEVPVHYPYDVIKEVKEPKEGFEDEIVDFIVNSQKGMKSLEELFFDETGKNAIWKGKETKGFKAWKGDRD